VIAALRRWLARLLDAALPGRAEADLSREVAAHLAMLEEEYRRRGMDPDDARAAARRAFGGVEQTKERHRDVRSFVWLRDVQWDLRYALRLLTRNLLFSLTAALSLAIGIGANTTIFTIANALLFGRPAGVAAPERVIEIGGTGTLNRGGRGGGFGQVSYPNYLDIRDRVTTLEGVYAYQPVAQPMSLGAASGAEPMTGGFVSSNYFALLGVRAAIGRVFDAGDSDQPGRSAIAVLSHRFWTRRFHADPAIVGRPIAINGEPFTVIGVAPEGFHGTSILLTDVWLPIGMGPAALLAQREAMWPLVGGRLKPGVSIAQAAAEVDAIGRALEREYPVENRGRGLRLVAATPIPGNILPVTGFLTLLMGIVSLVLVIACANVAGVLLARATARRREIAVRLAMGAGRWRLVRQLLTETAVLFAVGGIGGLLLARAMTTLLVSLLPALPLPVDISLPLDRHVVAFTALLSFLAAVLSGLVPALHASRSDVVAALKDESQGPSDRLRLRHAFVVGQVAISLLLVVSAALFVRALRKGGSIEVGFDSHGVELAALDLGLAGYSGATAKAFTADLIERVRQLPGVESAAIASTGDPVGDGRRRALLTVPGSTAADGRASVDADWNAVDSGYFATLRIPLLAGRDFTAADRGDVPLVAILGEAAASRFFPGRSHAQILGASIVLQPGQAIVLRGRINRQRNDPEWRLLVVGIARDIKYFGPRNDGATRFVYVPLQQQPFGTRLTIVARSVGGRRIAGDIRALVTSMDPNLPIVTSQTLDDRTALGVMPQRVAASVSGALGTVGLLLAAMGIYGVTAYGVTQRTREIGIRVALGASRGDVVWMVLRHGAALASLGTAIGLVLAAASGRLLASFLLGAAAIDALAFSGAALLFVIVGVAACVAPARRATRIDPIEALRYE
jgi:predicted permease